VKCRFSDSDLVANWYEVKELRKGLYLVDEQDHVAFFVLKDGENALFIDSGLGLSDNKAKQLLDFLKIKEFSVHLTHTHFDHVGLNYLAKEVHVSKPEWERLQVLDNNKHLQLYYDVYGKSLAWPEDLKTPLTQNKWEPTNFIDGNSNIQFGNWNLEAISLPGHSSGHLSFLDKQNNVIFLGDLIINGSNFIHLTDSSIEDYSKSLQTLVDLIQNLDNPLLLPCHNQIPLDNSYPSGLLNFIKDIMANKVTSSVIIKPDEFSKAAKLFSSDDFKITIRTDQLIHKI